MAGTGDLRRAAEDAVREVYLQIEALMQDAAREAVRRTLADLVGLNVPDTEVAGPEEDLMTRSEAARRLGTSAQTLMRLRDAGLLQEHRDGHRVLVSLAEARRGLTRPRHDIP